MTRSHSGKGSSLTIGHKYWKKNRKLVILYENCKIALIQLIPEISRLEFLRKGHVDVDLLMNQVIKKGKMA